MVILHFNRKKTATLLNWMAELPNRKVYFRNDDFGNALAEANKYSVLIIKVFGGFVFSVVIIIMFGSTLFAFVVLGKKYYLPLMSHLPFLPPTELAWYLINFVHQTYFVFSAIPYICVYVNLIFPIFLHVNVHLNGIKLLIGNMKEGIEAGDFDQWLKLVVVETRDNKE